MTSMPLTFRRMFAGELTSCPRRFRWPGSGGAAAVFRRAPLQLLLAGVLVGRLLDQRLDDLLVGLQPVGGDDPLAAVPGMHACPIGAHVVYAARADGPHHAGEAQRIEPLLVERQVLEAP